jgi:DNA-binding transcriptional regulator GbsR (MarR family)
MPADFRADSKTTLMAKQDQYFAKVNEFKERFRKLPTERLKAKLNTGYPLVKEAAVAVRELLEERTAREADRRPG